jgi:hypothetical protein
MQRWEKLFVTLHAVVVVHAGLVKLLCIARGGEDYAALSTGEHVARLE